MKKLLSLLSVLTISGTAVPTTIAASPYQKQEKILKRVKRPTWSPISGPQGPEAHHHAEYYRQHGEWWKQYAIELQVIVAKKDTEINKIKTALENYKNEFKKISMKYVSLDQDQFLKNMDRAIKNIEKTQNLYV
ncbi:hypothetical protein [Spiroplasma endosymbiont of Polydrusus cervinus]|uniref:hypothetical protein n=1 Tax=Spiroplasma endosymbiont of Polydrusus cervinus TaxID=3066287 RepID=UPI0030CABDEA